MRIKQHTTKQLGQKRKEKKKPNLEANVSETAYHNLRDIAKVVLGVKFIEINTYLNKQEKSQFNITHQRTTKRRKTLSPKFIQGRK